MEISHELFILSALIFAASAVIAFFRARREKDRFYYVGGGICLLGLSWSITAILGQVQLTAVFWLLAMIVSIVKWPELKAFQDRRMREVDIESPLRAADFFSNTYGGWLKLAYRHGLGITVILYLLQFMVLAVGMILALNRFYDLPSGFLFNVITMGGIFGAIWFYRRIKRGLTTIHLPPGSPTEK